MSMPQLHPSKRQSLLKSVAKMFLHSMPEMEKDGFEIADAAASMGLLEEVVRGI